jgi:hypothetical protein
MSNTNKQGDKSKNNLLSNNFKYIIIFSFLILVIASISFFILSQDDEKNDEKILNDEPEVIDQSICPENINQAVSIEIKRIHKIGIEDLFRKLGNNWKKPQNYQYQILIQDKEWLSNSITTWDTGYAGWESFYFTDTILESIDLTINIIEPKSGLFNRDNEIKETVRLNYDFKYGKWGGDDYFNDSDGYGHHIGDDYEIWFAIHQMEPDGDDISYWVENNILKTDPNVDDSKLDPDNDSIPTSWEYAWGYNPFKYDNHSSLDPDHDGLENIEEYQMEKWLANPYYKDIYLEVDFMEESPGLFSDEHVLWKESQYMLMDEFIPHDITIHIDDGWSSGLTNGGGEILPYIDDYISPISGIMSEFYKYNFNDERKGIFRYVAMVHSGGWCFPQTYQLWPDVMTIPTNRDFFKSVFFPPAITPKLKRLATTVALMHELGHSLNLNPDYCNGIDNASQIGRNNLPLIQQIQASIQARQYWTTYASCMNYAKFGLYILGYSNGSHGVHDSNDWDQIDLTFFQKSINEKYGINNN